MPILPSRPQGKYSSLAVSPEQQRDCSNVSTTPRSAFFRFKPNSVPKTPVETFVHLKKPEVKVYYDSIEDEAEMAAGNTPNVKSFEENSQMAAKRKSFPFFLKKRNVRKVSLESGLPSPQTQADPEAGTTFSAKRPTLKPSAETNQPFASLLRRIRTKDSFARLDDLPHQ